MENPQLPFCPNCGATMILKTKGEGKFYGCPNWRERGCKTLPYEPPKPKEEFKKVVPLIPDEEKFKQWFGLLRGDIKRIENKINRLLKKEGINEPED